MGTVSLSLYTEPSLGGTPAEPRQEGSCRSLTVRHRRAGHCFCLGFRLKAQAGCTAALDAQARACRHRRARTETCRHFLEGHSDNPNRMSFSSVSPAETMSREERGGRCATSWKTQRARLYPLRGHPEQAVRVSCGRGTWPEHFTPHSQFGISVGKCCLGLIKCINKCERRSASSLPWFRWREEALPTHGSLSKLRVGYLSSLRTGTKSHPSGVPSAFQRQAHSGTRRNASPPPSTLYKLSKSSVMP